MDALGVDGVPSGEHREWLLDGLARVIGLAGWEHFVRAPVLLPDDRHFPDAWERGPPGVKILLRRLLAYAGLGAYRVKLEIFREHNSLEFDRQGIGHGGPGAAAWFAGIADGVCKFGVNERELGDVEELIGTLGHEVAHAFRYHHGLVVRDSHIEERLTDVTTIYLGFGVFLLNSSFSFKTGGYSESGEQLLYKKQQRGYLSPPELALLLGVELLVRKVSERELKAIRRALSPNQAALLDEAWRSFEDSDALRRQLGVPERSEWGDPPLLKDLAIPLEPDDDTAENDTLRSSVAPRSGATPRQALRMIGNLSGVGAALGGVLPFVLAGLQLLEGWKLLVAPFACGFAGWVIGARWTRDTCSACGARVARKAESCESCGASLLDDVSSREERIAAEERLLGAAPAGDGDSPGEADYGEDQRLGMSMYAAWAIERDLILPEFAEAHTELVVAVRCGEFPADALASAWLENDLLDETGQAFGAWYTEGRDSRLNQDFRRLTTGIALTASRASYRRMADVLDARIAEWREAGGASSLPR